VISAPRWDQYFRGRPATLQEELQAALSQIPGNCQFVALSGGGDNPDYLVWQALKRQGSGASVISRAVRNESDRFENSGARACLALDMTKMVWGSQ
jgi:hypothetical protein